MRKRFAQILRRLAQRLSPAPSSEPAVPLEFIPSADLAWGKRTGDLITNGSIFARCDSDEFQIITRAIYDSRIEEGGQG